MEKHTGKSKQISVITKYGTNIPKNPQNVSEVAEGGSIYGLKFFFLSLVFFIKDFAKNGWTF